MLQRSADSSNSSNKYKYSFFLLFIEKCKKFYIILKNSKEFYSSSMWDCFSFAIFMFLINETISNNLTKVLAIIFLIRSRS